MFHTKIVNIMPSAEYRLRKLHIPHKSLVKSRKLEKQVKNFVPVVYRKSNESLYLQMPFTSKLLKEANARYFSE